MFKRALMATAITLAAASANAAVLLSETFDNVATLTASGWALANLSSPAGSTDWFQGDSTVFVAQAGGVDSYIAANYNNATVGGTIDNLLISPTFSTAIAGSVTFFAKAEVLSPYFDSIRFGINGSSGTPATFAQTVLTGAWTQYTVNFAAGGAGSVGRFVINYVGSANQSNYIGIDTFTVTSVPEPSTWLLFGAGLAGLGFAKRRLTAQG